MRQLNKAFFLMIIAAGCADPSSEKTSSQRASDSIPDSGNSNTDVDADGDGVLAEDDCDDSDPASTTVATDADCDGVLTDDDCDDTDPDSTTVATDADCDGVLMDDDCDDTDPESTTVAADDDCDGVLTDEDCDDTDPGSTTVAIDSDCDGILTEDDCDDTDATVYPGAEEIMGDGVDNNCNDVIDGELTEASTACCATPAGYGLYGPASEFTAALGDINGDGVNDFAMRIERDTHWVGNDRRFRADVFSGADFSSAGPTVLNPVAVDDDADDSRYRWPSSPMGDLDGDGIDEMFLNGNDGGMIVRSDDWATYLASGELPSNGPGRYGGNGVNVLFERIETADGPAVLLASRTDLGDSHYRMVLTRPASLLHESGWGSGGGLTWPNYDRWLYFSWSAHSPTHVFTADFDGDGLSDVGTYHPTYTSSSPFYQNVRVYYGANRTEGGFHDFEDADTVIEGSADAVRWFSSRYPGGRRGVDTADFDGDGYDDLATVDWEFGDLDEGRAYITSGAVIAAATSMNVDTSGTVIDGTGVGTHAVLQASLGGDADHDGNPDLWVVGVDHEVDSATQHARFFSGAGIVGAGTVSLSDADATWRPPASEYAGSAAEVWVSQPGDLDGDGFDYALLGATGQIWLLTHLEQ